MVPDTNLWIERMNDIKKVSFKDSLDGGFSGQRISRCIYGSWSYRGGPVMIANCNYYNFDDGDQKWLQSWSQRGPNMNAILVHKNGLFMIAIYFKKDQIWLQSS